LSYLTVALLTCAAALIGLSFVARGSGAAPARPARWGGVAIALAALAVGLLATRLPVGTAQLPALGLLPVLAGAGLVFLIGALDDVRPLPPIAKLAGQVLAASLTCSLGLTTGFLEPGPLNVAFTMFCLVGGANALNIIDGVDGLAGGIALVAAGAGFFLARDAGNLPAAVLAAALLGGSAAFLWLNLPPARVYMGDAGSNFLGFGLAAVPLLLSGGPAGFENFSATMLLLAVPIVETATSIGRRLLRGRSPLARDEGHIHHRLLRQGWPVGAVLALAWGLTLGLAILNRVAAAGFSAASLDRAATAWIALGALLLASSLYVGWHAGRLSRSEER
jgi:UDP-GlcNAc:undecaprenyl-phosphate GlcNAc-1-phosphate transferase